MRGWCFVKEKRSAKKVINTVVNVFIVVFTVFAIVAVFLAIASINSPDGVPSVGNKAVLTVRSPSMEPEFYTGDIIIGEKLEASEKSALSVNDIVTFNAGDVDGDGRDDLNTHRIIEVVTSEGGAVSYRTKGDNNLVEDAGAVSSSDVICKYNGTRIAKLGNLLSFLQTSTGFLVVIVIPLIACFVYELVTFILKVKKVQGEGKKTITAEDEELIRQKAIEEYIRSQQSGENADKTQDTDAEK